MNQHVRFGLNLCALLLPLVSMPASANKALTLMANGYDLLQKGDAKSAIAKFQQGLKADPNNALGWFYLGEAYAAQGNSAKASDAWQKSLQLDPNGQQAEQAKQRLTSSQPEKTPPKEYQESMSEVGAGILRQNSTGLLWTQSDNGADIDWYEATRYCSAKGDWRLPTREELKSLLGGSETTPCGITTCRVSPKFRLTYVLFWTNEMKGSSEAWCVGLSNGFQISFPLVYRNVIRALCVRRP